MNTADQQPTARIYEFRARPRQETDRPRQDVAAVTSLTTLRVPAQPVAFGCWYHEEALQDAPRAGKR